MKKRALTEAHELWVSSSHKYGRNMDSSRFDFANLDTLTDIDLSNAYLPKCKIHFLDIENVDLSSSNLSDSNLSCSTFKNVDFSNVNMQFARLENSKLINCNLSNADLTGTDFHKVVLANPKMTGHELLSVKWFSHMTLPDWLLPWLRCPEDFAQTHMFITATQ